MKNTFSLILLFPLMGCLPLGEPDQIQVDGDATIMAMPDQFDVSAAIYSRGDSREDALSNIANTYSTMREYLPSLDGLETLEIKTSTASVSPIFDYECADITYDEEECPIVGYHGEISISVQGAPADKAGNMLSYLSELGASDVEFDEFRIGNLVEVQKKALTAAVEDARRKAELIAAASGATIIGPVKIQSSQGFDQYFFGDRDTIIVTGSRVSSPKIQLDIEPQPVAVEMGVVAAFEIE